jgi:hypothetical protein
MIPSETLLSINRGIDPVIVINRGIDPVIVVDTSVYYYHWVDTSVYYYHWVDTSVYYYHWVVFTTRFWVRYAQNLNIGKPSNLKVLRAINHGSVEALTTGRMIRSGINSPPAEVWTQ